MLNQVVGRAAIAVTGLIGCASNTEFRAPPLSNAALLARTYVFVRKFGFLCKSTDAL
jgi:hypothetical protein